MKKQLTKSNTNIVLTGTLAGIAEYFNIDPTIVRVVFALIVLFGVGSPILLYILLALIIPRKRVDRTNPYGQANNYGQDNFYYQTHKNDRKDVTDSVNKKDEHENWDDF
jgi:phage shock protein PspC (stress-responsive transcriptional regulator)